MSNRDHYGLEDRIKAILRELPEKDLRERLCTYVDGATVLALSHLARVIGAIKS